MPTSLLTAAATAGAGQLFNSLTGNDGDASAALQNYTPPGINAGGLNATFGGNAYNVTPSADRSAAVGNVAGTYGNLADATAGLRGQVAPGFSAFRNAGLSQLENSRTSAIGNLRENLQRRRVLGSSFAQDAQSRTEAEFAQQKANFEASSYLQELEQTNNLLQQEFTARRAQYQTGLDEMNLEATLASNLSGKATDILGKNAQMEAQLAALSQQGAGKFFGQFMAPGIQKGVGDFLKGGFGSGGGGADLSNINTFVGPV